MILEIALGIVLAVIILAYWPHILSGGLFLVVVGLVLLAIAVAIFTETGQAIIVVATVGGVFLWVVNKIIDKEKEIHALKEANRKARASYSASTADKDLSPRLKQDEADRGSVGNQ